jgi:prepilin-type processing-associated H-X9-DG protein
MGLVFNMYANESRGGLFPPIKIWTCDDPPRYARDATFNGPSLYPEYLTDVNVCVCPSDSDATDMAASWHVNNDLNEPVLTCRLARGSYYYLGWAVYEPALLLPGVTVPTEISVSLTSQGEIAAYAATLIYEDVVLGFLNMYVAGFSPEAKEAAIGRVPRLRMGIERFFITDINNPAASAAASSVIPVMWDEIAVFGNAGTFNHVPGGGNCLYMDGHVEWLPWKTKFPSDLIGVLLTTVF